MAQNSHSGKQVSWVVTITIWTFLLSVLLSFVSQSVFHSLRSSIIALTILLIIVITGILFDMLGIAATAADEVPLLAKAAKKTPGAREALYLIRNADRFSNFCNDVVGDIAGIISGVLSALIVLRLFGAEASPVICIIATGTVSALTVGGKAAGKSVAITHSTEIILLFANILTKIEAVLPGKIFFGQALPRKRK